MKKSVLFKRIIALVLTAVMISGLLAVGMYTVIARRIFAGLRAQELLPIARRVAQMAMDNSNPPFERGNSDFLQAMLHIYDENGNNVMRDGTAQNPSQEGNNPPNINNEGNPGNEKRKIPAGSPQASTIIPPEHFDKTEKIASAVLDKILAGNEVNITVRLIEENKTYLVVGVPMIDQSGKNHGAVVFTKRLDEMDGTQIALVVTLLISTAAACVLMLIPCYYATRKITGPIRGMTDVSLAMARGDFSVRADENQKGELGELARSMNLFAEESGKLEQTRRDYVANVSHELRTPLASIRAMSETLKDGLITDPDKKMTYYGNIIRETMRLSKLVNDMLELSRLQSDAVALEKEAFSLTDAFGYVIEAYTNKADETDCHFEVDDDLMAIPPVYSNSDRIEQVLVILLDNAFKHIPEGGTVRLSAKTKDNMAEVSVSDNGEGISEEEAKHIFERFYKADRSHSSEGSGLGLAIASEIMRMLNESIYVESRPGEGSSFIFTIHTQKSN